MSNEDLEALREKEKITATNFIEKKNQDPLLREEYLESQRRPGAYSRETAKNVKILGDVLFEATGG